MRLGVFATGPVGRQVVSLTADRSPESLVLVGLDAAAPAGAKEEMAAASPQSVALEIGRRPDDATVDALAAAGLDLIVLAWWPYIVPDSILGLPRLGCLNFHPSLLPHNRGKDPNFWALVEQRPYGVTLHFADSSTDGGDIAYQREIPVTWQDTGETLYRRGLEAIVDLYREHLPEILAGDIPRARQPAGGSYHRRSELEAASELHLDAPTTGRDVLNLLRARTFPPHPAVWFVDDGVRYEARIAIQRAGD